MPTRTTFDAYIFDMDGLLVNSEPLWFHIETGVLQKRGKVYDPAVQKQFVGMRMDEFWTNMVRLYDLDDAPTDIIREVIDLMVMRIPHEVTAQPGTGDLLDFLLAKNAKMAIASSSPRRIIDAVVTAQGWDRYFPLHVSGDEVARGKPAPDVYLEAARQIGADPARCLALEDSPNGARAAVAAGMTCYAVPDRSHGHSDDFKAITPYVFESLYEVMELLVQD